MLSDSKKENKPNRPDKGSQINRVEKQRDDSIYFTMMPNIIDDLELDPFEFRLYMRLLRLAGRRLTKRNETTRQLADHCQISRNKIHECKKSLAQKGLIKITKVQGRHGYEDIIELVDIWKENMDHYASGHNAWEKLSALPKEDKAADIADLPADQKRSRVPVVNRETKDSVLVVNRDNDVSVPAVNRETTQSLLVVNRNDENSVPVVNRDLKTPLFPEIQPESVLVVSTSVPVVNREETNSVPVVNHPKEHDLKTKKEPQRENVLVPCGVCQRSALSPGGSDQNLSNQNQNQNQNQTTPDPSDELSKYDPLYLALCDLTNISVRLAGKNNRFMDFYTELKRAKTPLSYIERYKRYFHTIHWLGRIKKNKYPELSTLIESWQTAITYPEDELVYAERMQGSNDKPRRLTSNESQQEALRILRERRNRNVSGR